MFYLKIIRLIFTISLLTYSQISNACRDIKAFQIEDVVKADIVFIGTVLEYKISNSPRRHGILKFSIDRNILGIKHQEIIEVDWYNSTFSLPKFLDRESYLVAVTLKKRRENMILQTPCSSPFLLEPSESNINKVISLITE